MARQIIKSSRRFAIWKRDGFRCTYCRQSAVEMDIVLEVDHVVPVSHGGSDDDSNLTTACRTCNRKKGPHGPQPPREAGVHFSITLPFGAARKLDEMAKAAGLSRSALITQLVLKEIERQHKVDAMLKAAGLD